MARHLADIGPYPEGCRKVVTNTGESKNCRVLELRFLGMGSVADPKIHAPLHMCYHVKFGSFAIKGVRINRKEPLKIWDSLPWGGAWLAPRNTLLPNMCCPAAFGHSTSSCTRVIKEIRLQI